MNAWINQIAELIEIGRTGTDSSLSDMSQMISDARLLRIAGIAVTLMLVAFCQDRRLHYRDDRKSDTHQK
jgi:hypothetical protein